MTDESPLILQKFESGMLMWPVPRTRPDTAFVLSYRDGRMRTFVRAPGFADRAGSKWCFVVDKSQRISSGELQIPARGTSSFFHTWFDAAWQVTDPEAVVRADLQFGEPVVSGYLKSALRPLGQRFDIEDAGQVEEAAVRLLQPPVLVGSGLTLNGLTLRFSIDSRRAAHVTGDAELGRREQVQARVEDLRRLLGNGDPLLILHLAEHPDDTSAALQLINRSRQQDVQTRSVLLDRLMASGIISNADGDLLRPILSGGGPSTTATDPDAGPSEPGPPIGSRAAPSLPSDSTGGPQWPVPVLGSGTSTPPALPPAGRSPASSPSGDPAQETTSPPKKGPEDGGVVGWKPFRRFRAPRVVARPMPVTTGDLESHEPLDLVRCSVFSPAAIDRSESILVQVYLYKEGQFGQVQSLAQAFDCAATHRGVRCLDTKIATNTCVLVQLTAPGLTVDAPTMQTYWRGEPTSVQFAVTVPGQFLQKSAILTAMVTVRGVPVGHIKFKLTVTEGVGDSDKVERAVGDDARHYGEAFISYASEDRAEVLKRVQMLNVMNLRYFQDVLDLQPGSRWSSSIDEKIDQCDLFLLFWSTAAKMSPAVEREVRRAVDRKSGDDMAAPEIVPVILEGPPVPAPPDSLAHLHFNDQILLVLSGED